MNSAHLSLANDTNAKKSRQSLAKIPGLPNDLAAKYPDGIVIETNIRETLKALANHKTSTLLIIGETGTGKEEVAKILYRERAKKDGKVPFVEVNCSHLGSDLAHAKLFGHRRGAFTGANEASNGIIAEANGGILFLDEFHMMPKQCQADLLRVFNNGSYQRLGETKTQYSKFQVIIAAPMSLEKMSELGLISLDFATRLMGMSIELKPLRERRDDIKDLVEIYFARNSRKISKASLNGIVKKCQGYYWQGNIRMLFQALEILILQADIHGQDYDASLLPEFGLMHAPSSQSSCPSGSLMTSVTDGSMSMKEAVFRFEKKLIEETSRGTKSIGELAEKLGISRGNLDLKRKKYQIALS